MVTRIKAILEYDGTAYRGWQRQPDAPTVQETCESTLAAILGDRVAIVASGRTDAGVHARGQVVHFDHPGRIGPRDLRRAWNGELPDDVWVRRLTRVDPGFHARFDATGRTYRYFVAHGPRARSPFVRRTAWPIDRPLDWPRIEDATRRIVGAHDFRRFAKGSYEDEADSPGRCVVRRAQWRRSRTGHVLEIGADRFLRHMVRSLVAGLVAIGLGRAEPERIDAALAPDGEDPPRGHAPPGGLFLWRVDYGERDPDEA